MEAMMETTHEYLGLERILRKIKKLDIFWTDNYMEFRDDSKLTQPIIRTYLGSFAHTVIEMDKDEKPEMADGNQSIFRQTCQIRNIRKFPGDPAAVSGLLSFLMGLETNADSFGSSYADDRIREQRERAEKAERERDMLLGAIHALADGFIARKLPDVVSLIFNAAALPENAYLILNCWIADAIRRRDEKEEEEEWLEMDLYDEDKEQP